MQKAEELQKDTSNNMQIVDINAIAGQDDIDVDSLNLCAYEALARYWDKVKDDAGIKFDEVDNATAESGVCAEDVYKQLQSAESKWQKYVKEYFTTGTIKDLEVENLSGTAKNWIENWFKCPVSVSVNDPSGNTVGYVGDDDIWFDDSIYIDEIGDAKIICTPKEAGYAFDVKATNYGVVSYTVKEVTDGVYSDKYLNYYDIPVEPDTEIHVDLQGDSLNSESDVSVSCDGKRYSPESASASTSVKVSVNADSKKGSVTGAGSYMIGDLVSLVASPSDAYYFDGWYEGNSLKTYNGTYIFEARRDTVVTAVFTPRNPVEDTDSSASGSTKQTNTNNTGSGRNQTTTKKAAATVKKITPKVTIASAVYNGKAQKPAVVVKDNNNKVIDPKNYTVSYPKSVNAGTYKATVTLKGEYAGSAAASYTIRKAGNKMSVKAKTVKAFSKKKKTIKATRAFTVKNATGKVTYKKVSGNKKITVSKTGKITVKKGLKAGKTYKVKVKVTAAGNKNYKSGSKNVSLKIKVR